MQISGGGQNIIIFHNIIPLPLKKTSADAPAHGPTYPKGGQLGIFSMFFGWIVRESIPVPHFIINKSNDFLREYEMLLFSKCSCFSIRGNMLNPRGAPGAAKGFGIRFFSPSPMNETEAIHSRIVFSEHLWQITIIIYKYHLLKSGV